MDANGDNRPHVLNLASKPSTSLYVYGETYDTEASYSYRDNGYSNPQYDRRTQPRPLAASRGQIRREANCHAG